jgi:AcrR family transcriptional regulator
MAGRRERQKQLREARILRAAARLFETQGYDATGMKGIARRARLAVGTLYNYFPSKPELVLALIRRDAAEGLEAGEAVLKQPPADPVAAVQALLEYELEPFARHDRALWRELTAAALRDARVGEGFFATDLRLVAQLATLVRELAARGDLRDGLDPNRAAFAIYGVFLLWFLAFTTNEAVGLETARAEVRRGVSLVMHGLLAPGAGSASKGDTS